MSVSRVRENFMHGSMGGGRKPTSVGNAARHQAPPAYPTVALRYGTADWMSRFRADAPKPAWFPSCGANDLDDVVS